VSGGGWRPDGIQPGKDTSEAASRLEAPARPSQSGFRAAFKEALAAEVGDTGLESRFLDGSEPGTSECMPWLQQPGGDGTSGYWIGCGMSADPARPPASWPTFLWASCLYQKDGDPDGETLSVRPLDLTLTGTGARDPAILAAITVTAVLAHIEQGSPA
jgi:hypothetical protein